VDSIQGHSWRAVVHRGVGHYEVIGLFVVSWPYPSFNEIQKQTRYREVALDHFEEAMSAVHISGVR
jgi:hypothetical protein